MACSGRLRGQLIDESAVQSRGNGESAKVKVLASLTRRLRGLAQRPTQTISTERLAFTFCGTLESVDCLCYRTTDDRYG